MPKVDPRLLDVARLRGQVEAVPGQGLGWRVSAGLVGVGLGGEGYVRGTTRAYTIYPLSTHAK